ncbi:MAG: SIS domain-containing protein [Hyphomicrobium sp.]|uniref:SIS domain-containing protein n=1 Tax=Hyphomicrobium sp. TaxID=82 RepID=UPI00132AF073|nr:SIS domain-containing protein [Hyphomicrobium sp.]KAB2939993.1 MAG: SIS domain-containing protein [Hyphomicrobium sp.]MBZ0209861.1 SIS domain-containing protein [Hyphomicrobium sp.]
MLKGVVEATPADPISAYFNELTRALTAVRVSDGEGRPLDIKDGFEWVADTARSTHTSGNKVILIGNGGSAAVASHHAIEFLKNGGIRALALNDAAALTALSNDFGYANVFSQQLKTQGVPGDMLIAISSSGQSVNILKAVEAARTNGMKVATLSGFQPDNLLRGRGDVNFYVNSNEYGFVEVAHHALIQAILDIYVFPRRPTK